MADEEDLNSVKKELENLDARIDQLEDLQLTNKLNITELRREFDKSKDQSENSQREILEEAKKLLDELEEEEKGLEDWKDKFEDINERISSFDERIDEIGPRLESANTNRSNTEELEGNVCDKCGMRNDPDAKYCVVCGEKL